MAALLQSIPWEIMNTLTAGMYKFKMAFEHYIDVQAFWKLCCSQTNRNDYHTRQSPHIVDLLAAMSHSLRNTGS